MSGITIFQRRPSRQIARRSGTVAARAAPALLLAACATSTRDHSTVDAADGGEGVLEVPASDAGQFQLDAETTTSEPAFVSSVGTGTSSCDDGSLTDPGVLTRVPEFFTAFRYLPSSCEALNSQFLLFNTGDEPTEILGLGFAHPDFLLSREDLPAVLQPGASFGVSIRYVGDETSTTVPANITVRTSLGCSTYEVRGIAVDEAGRLVTYSPAAIDFGDVPIGTTSEIRTVSILAQYSEGMSPNEFYNFSSVDPAFEIVSRLPDIAQPAACEPLAVRVRFNAPTVPGWVESSLLWRVRTRGGTGEGTVLFPVFGHAVAPPPN